MKWACWLHRRRAEDRGLGYATSPFAMIFDYFGYNYQTRDGYGGAAKPVYEFIYAAMERRNPWPGRL